MSIYRGILGAFALFLVACGTVSPPVMAPAPPAGQAPSTSPNEASKTNEDPEDTGPLPPHRLQSKSRWVAVRWKDLPGFGDDTLFEAWNAWLRNCERPGPVFAPLCTEVRRLSIASQGEQQRWMMQRLQPYRIMPLAESALVPDGLLTGYYEPLLNASRKQAPGFSVPLYAPPVGLPAKGGRPWYSRQDIDSLPEAKAALAGREIAWLNDPIDALVLHIQGSGRLLVTETDGQQRLVRVAFAGTNEQPYKSVGRWLIDQGQLRDASWPGIKGWIAQNPQRVQELLWSNPRFVFFKEEAIPTSDVDVGPKGAQGVALTAGRSIAVDPGSIPYGTPVWLASGGPTVKLQRLVFAQDTGSAIVGAVRADFFVGAGPQAGDVAGRLKQNLQLWALWPK